MKKILFASTALVALAGAAHADVAISGAAEIGVIGGKRYNNNTQFHDDVDVNFKMTGEADNGLTFGASVDLDEASAGFSNTDDHGVSYFVAYGNARLDMGDTDGGLDWALQEVNLAGGSIDDSETAHPGFNGNGNFDGDYDGQIARFTYTFGDFAAALSAEVDDAGVYDAIWGLGFKYSGDLGGTKLSVGLGFQQGDKNNANAQVTAAQVTAVGTAATSAALTTALANADDAEAREAMGISVAATLSNGISTAVNYTETKYASMATLNTATEKHTAIGFGYSVNALAIGLNYGKYENRYGVSGLEASGFGLAVAYDLGGGLAVQAGYGNGETKAQNASVDFDSFSLGLAMSF